MSLGDKGISSFVEADTNDPELSFPGSAQLFGNRLRDALRRRLAPNTALHIKQLAHAIGVTERGINKILSGDSYGQAVTVSALIHFFWGINDRGFIAEIYGLPPLMTRAEAVAQAESVSQVLEEALAKTRRAAGGDRFKRVWPPRLRVAA